MMNTATLGIRFDSLDPVAEAWTPSELDALPAGSRILAPYPEQDGRGDILVRHNDGLWHRDLFAPIPSDALVAFPIRILS